MEKWINYPISKTKAVSTLGRGRKSARRYLVEGNENIEHGGDRLAKVPLMSNRASSIIACQVGN